MPLGLPSLNPRGGPPPGPGAGAQAYGRMPSVIPQQPGAPAGPSSLFRDYASLFGTTSPQEALRRKSQGQPPTLTSQPLAPAPGLPPEQAGVVQSVAPGAQNGNAANGYHDPMGSASAQVMRQVGVPQQRPMGPMAGLPGGQPQAQPAPPPQQPPMPMGGDPVNMLSQLASQLGLPQPHFNDPGMLEQQAYQAPAAPVAQAQEAPQVAPLQAQEPLTPGLPQEEIIRSNSMQTFEPPTYTAAEEIPVPPTSATGALDTSPPSEGRGNFNTTGINTADGFKSWSDAGWNAIANNTDSGEKLNARLSYIENSEGKWTQNFWDKAFGPGGVTGSTRDLPAADGTTNYGLTIEGTDLPDSIFDQVDNTGVQDLLRKWEGWSARVNELEQVDGAEKDRGKIQEIQEKLKVAESALGQYGITANAVGEFPDTTGGPDDVFGDDLTREENDPFRLVDPDAGIEPKMVTQMFGPRSGRTPQENAAAAEMSMQILTDDAARKNQQLGINELVRSISDFQSSDLFGGIQDQARAIAGQDNFDFNGIRNQAVSDQNQAFNTSMQQLGGSAASRGLGSASVSGLAGELGLDNASALSRLLGDINLQEQQSARDFQLQGLGALQSSFGSTEGPLAQLRQQLAGSLGAQTGQSFNPASGALDASGGLLALDRAGEGLDLAKDQQSFQEKLAIAQAIAQASQAFAGGG